MCGGSWSFYYSEILAFCKNGCAIITHTSLFMIILTGLTHLGFLFYGKGIINQVILEVGILLQGKDGLKYSFYSDYDKILNQ